MTVFSHGLLACCFLRRCFPLPLWLCRYTCIWLCSRFMYSFCFRLRRYVAIARLPFAIRRQLFPGAYLLDNLPAPHRGIPSGKRLGAWDAMLCPVRAAVQSVQAQMAEG